ncbi:MAG: Uma2 family endonuclease [Lachnospiraceae bacterium]|nr:Uma2 family endonuclease [Lachnospiraceae bacterium]
MPLLKEQFHTIEEIYRLPEGERAELIDGQIYYMALPKFWHQKILNYINTRIYNYIEEHGGPCEVIPAPFAVFLNNDDYTYVEPDISVICDRSKLDDRGCNGAPDWIVEIVSPGSKQMDYFTKLFKYRTAGVREYWIVDPQKNSITVYNFESETVSDYSFSESVKAGIYEDLSIDFSVISLENM